MASTDLTHRVADEIRRRLRDLKIPQETLAAELNLSQQAVSRRLLGDVELGVNELDTIARVVGTSVSELLDLDGTTALAEEVAS